MKSPNYVEYLKREKEKKVVETEKEMDSKFNFRWPHIQPETGVEVAGKGGVRYRLGDSTRFWHHTSPFCGGGLTIDRLRPVTLFELCKNDSNADCTLFKPEIVMIKQ